MAGERKGSDTPGSRSSGGGVGPVAQRIRARGYEPRCRGFESLLAQNRQGPFPFGSRKIMIGIAELELWNLVVVCRSGMGLIFFFITCYRAFFYLQYPRFSIFYAP